MKKRFKKHSIPSNFAELKMQFFRDMFSAVREKTVFPFRSNPNSNAVAIVLILYDTGETSAYKV
jgi:hypothetical protein